MKVKITSFWMSDIALFNLFVGFGFGNPVWKDMELVAGDEYDMLVILTRPFPGTKKYDVSKAITLLTEPPATATLVPHETSAVLPMYLPIPLWQNFGAKDREMVNNGSIGKSELLSSVTSGLNYLEGHKARLQFISILDSAIEEGFDLWGKPFDNRIFDKFGSYRGELENKYDALWTYQYHFACENSFVNDYFTEKIVDPILAECLCFYDGCLNLEAYIDERAFIRIDIFEPFSAVEKIIGAIETNEWEKRIAHIRKQKARLLHELNPLNIIWLAVSGKDVQKECML